jgi:hypothetical protein
LSWGLRMKQPTEPQFLLQCLAVDGSEAHADGLAQLADSGWDDLVTLADRHGLTPVLYQRLRMLGASASIPRRAVQRLGKAYLSIARDNQRLYAELGHVLRALQKDRIPTIALKGAHLAAVVYGNIALRPMCDVDLLVKSDDLSAAEAVLLGMGYEQYGGADRFAMHLAPLIKPGMAPVEIHWTIEQPANPFKIDTDGLWERARSATIAGVEVLVLSPEDLLLHLCLHTCFQNMFDVGLRGLCDIATTIHHYHDDIDWARVQQRARAWGARNGVYLTLYLARELLQAAVPEETLASLKPDALDPQVVALAREFVFDPQEPFAVSAFAQLWTPRPLRQRVSALLKGAVPSMETLARMYPATTGSWRLHWRYVQDLTSLTPRYIQYTWRMLRHDRRTMSQVARRNQGAPLLEWLASG